ncbi:MAG: hypothetical protein ACHQYQ_04390, partial [Bacteriovoracales bacterium]
MNDDAVYIIGAKSLLSGKFIDLANPNHSPLINYLPGYPLLLAPFVKIVDPHWIYLKFLSSVLIAISGLLLWKLLDPWFSPLFRLLFLCSFVFNPTVVNISSMVMSEPCFLFSFSLALITLKSLIQSYRPWKPWVLGLLLGWASLIRPQGICLILGVSIALLHKKQWGNWAKATFLSVGIYGGIYLRNYFLTKFLAGYMSEWNELLPYLGRNYDQYLAQTYEMFKTFFIFSLFPIPTLLSRPYQSIAYLFTCFLGIVFGGIGIAHVVQKKKLPEELVLSITLSCFFCSILQMLWARIEPRYFFFFIPFSLLFIFSGAESILSRLPRKKLWASLGFFLLMAVYANANLRYLSYSNSKSQIQSVPFQTFQWIRENVPKKAIFLSINRPTLFLYTGHCGYDYFNTDDIDDFRYTLSKEKITHVMFVHENILYFSF